MLNKIVCDKDLNVELVINIQAPRTFDDTWDNSIIISIDADDTANQSLYVNAEQATATYLITPSQINDIEIETEYWNMGGASTITLRKGSTAYGTITINFPDEIDSLGMLNRDENIETTFTMTGSYNDPSDIATKVEEKQDKLVAGSGISIEGNVISATGGGGGGVNYSLDEQDTGLQWLDGKPIYQKTLTVQITAQQMAVSLGQDIKVDNFVDIWGFIAGWSNTQDDFYPIGYFYSQTYQISYYAHRSALGDNIIYVNVGSQGATIWNNKVLTLTVQYTKQ